MCKHSWLQLIQISLYILLPDLVEAYNADAWIVCLDPVFSALQSSLITAMAEDEDEGNHYQDGDYGGDYGGDYPEYNDSEDYD